MKLKDILDTIGNNTPIRIFAGCMTIFSGKVSDADQKEWNLKVLPYMNCNVHRHCVINGVVVLAI